MSENPQPPQEQMSASKDFRSPLAKARDKYLQSKQGKSACDPATLGARADQRQYLENRITLAFLAGADAAKSLQSK